MGELYELYPKLPKNIRQIGERDTVLRLYVEDYVNTYLKRLKPGNGQNLRVGLLLGNREIHEDMPHVFVDGAMEMELLPQDGEKVVFTEEAWKRAYQQVETMFPRRTVQGWFLCAGEGITLNPLNYWRQHSQYFTGKNQLMYLNSGLDGEEAVYITSTDGFYQLRGYSIYYERNQLMQDYMIARKDILREESRTDDRAIRDFRKKMDEHRTAAVQQKSTVNVLSGLCSVLAVMVLAGGVAMFNNYKKLHEMEEVVASADPGAVIREARGGVYPSEGEKKAGNQPWRYCRRLWCRMMGCQELKQTLQRVEVKMVPQMQWFQGRQMLFPGQTKIQPGQDRCCSPRWLVPVRNLYRKQQMAHLHKPLLLLQNLLIPHHLTK